MIKNIFNVIRCIFKKHNMMNIGSCPFTGKEYNACIKCGKTTAIDNKQPR